MLKPHVQRAINISATRYESILHHLYKIANIMKKCSQCSLFCKGEKKFKGCCSWNCLYDYVSRLEINKSRNEKKVYSSQKWRKLRYKILSESKRECSLCKSKDELHIDHIKPLSKYPHLGFELSNLQILCKQCNFGKSNLDDKDFRSTSPLGHNN